MTAQQAIVPGLTFCVFSYNRGIYLKNCIESVERAAPDAEIVVYDDDSNDTETLRHLAEIAQQHTIVSARRPASSKHGGLYHNMQAALEALADRRLLCLLQDDTQIVRPLLPEDVEELDQLFRENPSMGFVQPCFIKSQDQKKGCLMQASSPDLPYYFRPDGGQSAGIFYSDLCILSPGRLLERGWRFRSSESANDKQARDLFQAMAYLKSPFVMWLPLSRAYRGRARTLGMILAEKRKRCGFYPFKFWTPQQAAAFRARSPQLPAVAEEFLQCERGNPQQPWSYNPLHGLRLYKQMDRLEVLLRRMFSS